MNDFDKLVSDVATSKTLKWATILYMLFGLFFTPIGWVIIMVLVNFIHGPI